MRRRGFPKIRGVLAPWWEEGRRFQAPYSLPSNINRTEISSLHLPEAAEGRSVKCEDRPSLHGIVHPVFDVVQQAHSSPSATCLPMDDYLPSHDAS